MTPSLPNPNWPTLFAEGQFASNPFYGTLTGTAWADMTQRLYQAWSIKRGKQYELDAVQAGEFHGQWVNTDGALDPSNVTNSPYSPTVYRGYRMRTQYPPSVNLLSADQATGGGGTPLAVGTSGNGSGVFSAYGAYAVTSSGTAYQGSTVWQFTGTTPSASGLILYLTPAPTISTGAWYTFSLRVRSVTTGANPGLIAGLQWVSPSGLSVGLTPGSSATLTGSPSAAWTTFTVTSFVPGPSGSAYPVAAQLSLTLTSNPAGTWSLQVDGVQFEAAISASAFVVPGASYPLYSGLIERYPQSWDYTGTYGIVTPVCVDAMALLSQTILKESFIQEVLFSSPLWFYPLNDPAPNATVSPVPPQTFAEQSGLYPTAAFYNSSYGAGTAAAGTSVTAAVPAGMFLGTGGPVVSISNPATTAGTVVSLDGAGIAGPPGGAWTRMLAFRTSAFNGYLAAATTGLASATFGPGMYVSLDGSGNFQVSLWNAAQQNLGVVTSTGDYADGNWHLAFWSLDIFGQVLTVTVDGLTTTASSAGNFNPVGCVDDAIGGDMYSYSGSVNFGGGHNFVGDIAHYAEWGSVLSAGQKTTLYNSWRSAWVNDSSDQRYARVLQYAGYLGPQKLDFGTSRDLQPMNDIGGLDALTALENVVETEGGRHFIDASGNIVFQSRQRFFQSFTPMWTFGENQGSGEIPYVDMAFDFDPTQVSNQIVITQTDSSLTFNANDATSQLAYGVRTLSRTNQSFLVEECRESAYFYLAFYKQPAMRVQVMKIDVASNPSLWPSALAFELGQYVQINRRSVLGAPTISQFGFIEQITHNGDEKGAWTVDLQISPASPTAWASFTDLRTTLHTTVSAGAGAIVINPLPDAATNNVQAELTGNQMLLIGSGATQELVYIAVGGVSNSAPGYTSATLTLQSSLIFSHTSGEPVVEYNGANYDPVATFGSVQFTY